MTATLMTSMPPKRRSDDMRDTTIILEKLDRLIARIEGLERQLQKASNGIDLYTVKQAAKLSGYSTRTIMRRIKDGKLPVTREGTKPMIHREHIELIGAS